MSISTEKSKEIMLSVVDAAIKKCIEVDGSYVDVACALTISLATFLDEIGRVDGEEEKLNVVLGMLEFVGPFFEKISSTKH